MNNRKLILSIFCIITIFAILLVTMLFSSYSKLDPSALAAIWGALAGSVGILIGSVITAYVTIWDKTKETDEKLKARIADHALELTKLDYQLRQQSLAQSKKSQEFLAPVKVYRELYKALLEYEKSGIWPKNVEQLGLLNVFILGENRLKITGMQDNETNE